MIDKKTDLKETYEKLKSLPPDLQRWVAGYIEGAAAKEKKPPAPPKAS